MLWYVAIGSAAGGVARFLLGTFIQQKTGTAFPVSTLLVNLTGSLVLGFMLPYALATPAISPEIRALITTGFCGGYTTFSTFSYETVRLAEDGDHAGAFLYVTLSVIASLGAAVLGFRLARELLAARRGL